MTSRLAPLDVIDAMRDTWEERDVKQLRYGFVRRCAGRMCNHWLRLMQPSITKPVMKTVVDARLRTSLSLIAASEVSSATCVDRWWHEAALPTSMGGVDVGGSDYRAEPASCAAILAVQARLTAPGGAWHGIDVLGSDAPMFVEFRSAYSALAATRDAIATDYADNYDDLPCYTLRGGMYKDMFHPKKLPQALPSIAECFDRKSRTPKPSQRTLTMIEHHKRWGECLAAAKQEDADNPSAFCRNREAVRFISVSQYGGGAAFDLSPDGTYSTTIDSADFEVNMERHGGLDVALAKGWCDAEEAAGRAPDRKGDSLANGGEYNRQHNSVNNRAYDMVSAVAIGQVIKGDKANPSLTADLNEDHVTDLAEIGGDDLTGGDVLIETKVPGPLVKTHKAGGKSTKGATKDGGTVMHVGHLYGFGNTEEAYRRRTASRSSAAKAGAALAMATSTTGTAVATLWPKMASTAMHSSASAHASSR